MSSTFWVAYDLESPWWVIGPDGVRRNIATPRRPDPARPAPLAIDGHAYRRRTRRRKR